MDARSINPTAGPAGVAFEGLRGFPGTGEGEKMDKMTPSAAHAAFDPAVIAALVERGRTGDNRAMEEIYLMFKKPVFGIIYRHVYNRTTAEDLLQEVFVKVFTNLDGVRDAATFPAWVYRIALNSCFSHLRRVRSEGGEAVPLDDVEGVVSDDGREESGSNLDMRTAIDKAVAALPPKLKQVFILHDVQGFKHEEISEMTGCSVGTSKSQLFKARLKLRTWLQERRAV